MPLFNSSKSLEAVSTVEIRTVLSYYGVSQIFLSRSITQSVAYTTSRQESLFTRAKPIEIAQKIDIKV